MFPLGSNNNYWVTELILYNLVVDFIRVSGIGACRMIVTANNFYSPWTEDMFGKKLPRRQNIWLKKKKFKDTIKRGNCNQYLGPEWNNCCRHEW